MFISFSNIYYVVSFKYLYLHRASNEAAQPNNRGATLQTQNNMRTETINIFTFEELSEEAQNKAVELNSYEQEYFWADDSINSLKKFAEHFNSSLSNWSIDFLNSSQSSVSFSVSEYMEELSEEELKSYIFDMGTFNAETLRGDGECKFTGYCRDEDAADGARIAYFKGERDIKELLEAGFETWHKAVVKDYEYQLSKEGYKEHCEANSLEFTEDGELI